MVVVFVVDDDVDDVDKSDRWIVIIHIYQSL
jgi:hypothetical protein